MKANTSSATCFSLAHVFCDFESVALYRESMRQSPMRQVSGDVGYRPKHYNAVLRSL